jgi:hypothetical protein
MTGEDSVNKNRKQILWITRTAIFIALLIVIQVATKPIGITQITGSLVNMILIVSVMTCGLSSGLTVAVISPVFAMLIGIGPMWILIPFIALGNCVLILIWYVIGVRAFKEKLIGNLIALIFGAAAKFLVLYFSIVRMMIPLFLNLPANKAGALTATFSLPQLFTALIGGVLAILVLPIIKKATAAREG